MRVHFPICVAILFLSAFPTQATKTRPGQPAKSIVVRCPAVTKQFVVTEGLPVSPGLVGRALQKRWSVRAELDKSGASPWRKLSVLSPRYNGVVLLCEGRASNVRIQATVGLLRMSCKPDQKRKVFLCLKY